MQELVLKLAGSFGHRTAGELIVLLSLLLFLLLKGLYSLNSDRAKARQEFLQLWDFERAKRDPLWCEVLIRHYCREFLPARLIVKVAANSQAADTLWALSQSARFFQLDDGLVRWKDPRHARALFAGLGVILGTGLYFVFAMASLWLLFLSFRGLGTVSGHLIVVMVVCALVLGGIAIKLLNHGLDLAGARKNFIKVQNMQPSLVPEPMLEFRDSIVTGESGVREKRRSNSRPASSKTKGS
ncbi:hypothetical protein [Stenotrophomonas sp.]|uniref:hypothetical protein n=1 Tax=Stenotrophomonas sp. TaxID=69392 RepID=UPI0028AA2ACF|nr:hypothetical protein [Stenotrophomonas sp.]